MLRSDVILYVHLAAMMVRVSYSVFLTMDAVGGCKEKEEGDRQSGWEDILEAEECSISSFSLIIYI